MIGDIKFTRGDDIDLELEFIDEITGNPLNITGSTIFFTVKKAGDVSIDDTSAIIKKDQSVHTDPTAGKTTISLTHTETDVVAGTYDYDFQVKDTYGKIASTESGKIIIEKDVTRRIS